LRTDAARRQDPCVTVGRLADAVRAGDVAAAAALLAARPELVHFDMSEHDEHRVLHYAVLNRDAAMVRLLMEHGADPYQGIWPHRDATAALTLATDRGYDEIRALIRDVLRTRASAAVARGAVEAEGPRPNPPDGSGQLTRAVIGNRPDVVTRLLDLGVDPNERHRLASLEEDVFSWGEPLREAVRTGNVEIAGILLQRGADPNPQIYAATSPLFEAHQRHDHDMTALLERHGARADALIIGYFGLVQSARELLAATPDTAADLLVNGADGGQVEIVRLALDHLEWPPGDARWHWHLMRPLGAHSEGDRGRYLTCVRLMLDRAGADAPGPHGRSILHDVCGGWPRETTTAEDRLAMATVFLDAGARLDRRDELLRSTPLGWACRWGRIELVRLFLERGADAREPDTEPWATPRAWAERMNRPGILALLDGAVS
jgi:ankyrin repeat protein